MNIRRKPINKNFPYFGEDKEQQMASDLADIGKPSNSRHHPSHPNVNFKFELQFDSPNLISTQ